MGKITDEGNGAYYGVTAQFRTDMIRGDVDGDKKVTSDDAIRVLYHSLFPDDYEINQKTDFDGDGKETSDDAIYLLYYTLFPEQYPLH